ncbi:uncharacterized protein DUF4249 [Ancylomarina subtilis]|uniref:Uncharacterized protein DUF4249 n=2 Tax=Ancylomarina subtilis TaxID=1639035 RepID=A0A4Q7V702_9BACT|nr:uncharacterized protein DUF4249 [Ancylomarina subtilis]
MLLKEKLLYFSVLLILLNSCTEKFYPDTNEDVSTLVIDGKITNGQGPYEVRLFRTVSINIADTLLPEIGAVISIYDNDGNSDSFTETTPGLYHNISPDFKGKVGHSYWIEIQTLDGKKYESTPETIPPQIEIEKIYGEEITKIMPDGEKLKGAGFFVDAKSNTNQNIYLKWDYQESWEWQSPYFRPITDNPSRICYPYNISNNISVFDGSQYDIKQFNHLATSFVNQEEVKLNYAYFLNVSLYSISLESYEFWESMQKINQNNGGIYDNIPGNITGNICACNSDDSVLGYFEASSVNSKNKIFSTADFNMKFSDFSKGCENFQTLVPPDGENYIEISSEVLDGIIVYTVRRGYCYDCNLIYSPLKPSFWP